MPMSTKFEMRGDPGVMRNYGRLLVDLAATVPDGVVAFFVSYRWARGSTASSRRRARVTKVWSCTGRLTLM